jgi:hypothetical protein
VLDADGTSGDRLTVRSGDRLTVRSYNVGDGRLPTNQRRENALDRPLAVWPRGTSSASRGLPDLAVTDRRSRSKAWRGYRHMFSTLGIPVLSLRQPPNFFGMYKSPAQGRKILT